MFDKNEVLKDTYIPPQIINDCYISTDGLIFAPEYDENGDKVKTAMQFYEEWLERMNRPLPPTPMELLQEENRLLRAQITAESDRSDFIEDCIAEMAAQVYV